MVDDNTPDQEQIDHWISVSEDGIREKWELYRGGFYQQENLPIQGMYSTLALKHASLARARFLNGDPIDEVRAEFAEAARHVLKAFRMTYDSSDKDYQGDSPNTTYVEETGFVEGVNYACMAGDFDLAAELSHWWRDPAHGTMPRPINGYVHAYAHLLKDERLQARELLDALMAEYQKKPAKGAGWRMNYFTLTVALSGIAHRDANQFNEGLKAQLLFYQSEAKGESRNTTGEFICDNAVALANLGLRHGLQVTVQYPTLPPGLLIPLRM